MINKIKDKTSNWSFSSFQIRLFLSLMRYTSMWLCVQMRSASFFLYSFTHLIFHSTISAPLNLIGMTLLGRLKTSYYYIMVGANEPTYNGGVFLMTLYWPSTILMILQIGTSGYNEIQIILLIGTSGYNKWIHFEVTITQHSPWMRMVFYNYNNNIRRRRENIFNIIKVIHL